MVDNDKIVIENPDDPYKATLTWAAEGVRITVECEYPGLTGLQTEEVKAECDRRAKAIVDHFQFLIGKDAKREENR